MSIKFTQYLLPNGRAVENYIDMSVEIEKKAHELIDAGCHFDAEVLTTGLVSFTCERGDELISIQLSPNGPEVIEAVTKLIEGAYKYTIKETHDV